MQLMSETRKRTRAFLFLKSKLFSYGIGGKTLKWIDSFLCFRQQQVVINGVKFDWAPVLSGVPPGHRPWSLVFFCT